MYKTIDCVCPCPLLEFPRYMWYTDTHIYNTTKANQANSQFYRIGAIANSSINEGPVYWLSLPEDIKRRQSIEKFNMFHHNCILSYSLHMLAYARLAGKDLRHKC